MRLKLARTQKRAGDLNARFQREIIPNFTSTFYYLLPTLYRERDSDVIYRVNQSVCTLAKWSQVKNVREQL